MIFTPKSIKKLPNSVPSTDIAISAISTISTNTTIPIPPHEINPWKTAYPFEDIEIHRPARTGPTLPVRSNVNLCGVRVYKVTGISHDTCSKRAFNEASPRPEIQVSSTHDIRP